MANLYKTGVKLKMKSRHALVTGGSGFLGRNLIQQLLEQQWTVTVVHRKNSNIDELAQLPVTLLDANTDSATCNWLPMVSFLPMVSTRIYA